MRWMDMSSGFNLAMWGLFKKVVVADNLALIVTPVFRPGNFSVPPGSIHLGALAFAFQIYCDFSGYTDIARGVARIMGFRLMDNFRQPYFATSIADFWRRWHISLSTWLRDYLYVPLGGNRHGTAKTYRNLLLTMLLGGIWHGAGWTFVIWGAYQGALLVLERLATGRPPTVDWFEQRTPWERAGVDRPGPRVLPLRLSRVGHLSVSERRNLWAMALHFMDVRGWFLMPRPAGVPGGPADPARFVVDLADFLRRSRRQTILRSPGPCVPPVPEPAIRVHRLRAASNPMPSSTSSSDARPAADGSSVGPPGRSHRIWRRARRFLWTWRPWIEFCARYAGPAVASDPLRTTARIALLPRQRAPGADPPDGFKPDPRGPRL